MPKRTQLRLPLGNLRKSYLLIQTKTDYKHYSRLMKYLNQDMYISHFLSKLRISKDVYMVFFEVTNDKNKTLYNLLSKTRWEKSYQVWFSQKIPKYNQFFFLVFYLPNLLIISDEAYVDIISNFFFTLTKEGIIENYKTILRKLERNQLISITPDKQRISFLNPFLSESIGYDELIAYIFKTYFTVNDSDTKFFLIKLLKSV